MTHFEPCPFCGERDDIAAIFAETFAWGSIVCGACDSAGPIVRVRRTGVIADEDREAAAREWNRRAPVEFV